MTMPDKGVPSYATGRRTFMILHDYDQKVANDPKLSKAAGKVKNALMPGKTHSTFAWTAAYLMAKEPIDVDRAWSLVRFFGGKSKDGQYHVIKRWALEFGLGSGYHEVMSDPEDRRKLLQMARRRHLEQAAATRYLAQDRQGDLVPGMGSVHDATRAGLHPQRRFDRPDRRSAVRQGRRS